MTVSVTASATTGMTADRAALRDWTDVLWYAALALLPVDGTVWGVQMPYWSPIAPVLFLLYAACNARLLPRAAVMVPFALPLTALLLCVSAFGWITVGVNLVYLPRTLLALLFALATLASMIVAWSLKRLSLKAAVTVLVAAYAVAFAFGVFTWLVEPRHPLDSPGVRRQLMDLYLRQYFVVRPQFLFAEPSYIGMHLFGVLLPMFWVTRDRRLPVLVAVFAIGALAMGSGARIAVDTAAAGLLWAVAACPWRRVWRDLRLRVAACGAAVAAVGAAALVVATQPRIRALFSDGFLAGDASMSARVFRSVAPLSAAWHDPAHLLLGFGAGNIATAMQRGYAATYVWFTGHHGMVTDEIRQLAAPMGASDNRAGNVFTMNAYASFVTEFGLVLFVAAVALIIRHVTVHHAWNVVTACWLLLLAYLYLQFEAYAFPALPLFLWATSQPMPLFAHHPCGNETSLR